MKIEVPYITDDGQPIHMVNEGVQRGYMQGLTTEEVHQLMQHANGLAQNIHSHRAERAECKRKAREFMRIPEGSSAEVRQLRMKQLEALKGYYDDLAKHIEKLKSLVYVKTDEGLVLPRMPKGPASPL